MNKLYDEGYKDGQNTDNPTDDFEMHSKKEDYMIGYVHGYASMESVRNACSWYAGKVAGELTKKYSLPYKEVIKEYENDSETYNAFEAAYSDSNS